MVRRLALVLFAVFVRPSARFEGSLPQCASTRPNNGNGCRTCSVRNFNRQVEIYERDMATGDPKATPPKYHRMYAATWSPAAANGIADRCWMCDKQQSAEPDERVKLPVLV